jgi:hypothetical protein
MRGNARSMRRLRRMVIRQLRDMKLKPLVEVYKSDVFVRAVMDFGESYADQAERDHAAFMKAVRSERVEAQVEH